MKISLATLFVLLLGTLSSFASPDAQGLDSNIAFYEGEELNYLVYPPDGYRMVIHEASADGYTSAFIPRGTTYDEANVIIGVNYFKIRGLDFQDVVTRDTLSMREHFGNDVSIWPVDSIFSSNGDILPSFYINDPQSFIPNVMIAYYNGQTEILIFELIIDDGATRFKAEEVFVECLGRLKVLRMGELGYN